MVVISAGIRPNARLAREAGLTVERGIVVNDFMACVRRPARLRRRRVRAAQRQGLRPGRAAVGTDRRAGRPLDRAQPGRRLQRLEGFDQAESHGRGPGGDGATGRARTRRRGRDLRRAVARRLQEADRARRPARRSDPARRRGDGAGAAAGLRSRRALPENRAELLFPLAAAKRLCRRSSDLARRRAQSATATACRRARSSPRCRAAVAASNRCATRRAPERAAARASRRRRRCSNTRRAICWCEDPSVHYYVPGVPLTKPELIAPSRNVACEPSPPSSPRWPAARMIRAAKSAWPRC